MAATKYNFPNHIKGDTFLAQSFIFKKNAVAIDLTGGSFRMMIKKHKRDTIAAVSLTDGSGITVTDAVNGVWEIDDQVIDIDEGKYYYDVEYTYPSGIIATYLSGFIEIIQDITN